MKKILSILYTASAILLWGCGDDSSTSPDNQIATFSSAEETSSSSFKGKAVSSSSSKDKVVSSSSFKDNAVSSSRIEHSTKSSSSTKPTSSSLVSSSSSKTTSSHSGQSSSSKISSSSQSSSSGKSSSSEESSSATVSSSSLFNPCSEAPALKENWKYLNPNVQYGCFKDSRDNQYYATVKIGDYTWMAENLGYNPRQATTIDSWYGYNTRGFNAQDQRGYLYTWDIAMADTSCHKDNLCKPRGQMRGICPEGFHIPSYWEWQNLFNSVGGESTAARDLKSTEIWADTAKGINKYGFSVIPNGPRFGGTYNPIDFNTVFWTSIEIGKGSIVTTGFTDSDKVNSFMSENKEFAFSIRCLMDYSEQETPHSGIPHDPDKIYQCDEMLMDDINTWHFKNNIQDELQYFIDDTDSISVRIKSSYSEYTTKSSYANNEDGLYYMFWTAMFNCK